MALTVTSRVKSTGVYVVSPVGSLDTNTYDQLEKRLEPILQESPRLIVFDMAGLEYISSMGVRVFVKLKKQLKKTGGTVTMLRLQPQIQKVFEIINALPSVTIFSSIEEMDNYLDLMQRETSEKNG